ncbi:hypothetical protein QOT17_022685, partial [Balamuthia mandrillaris]
MASRGRCSHAGCDCTDFVANPFQPAKCSNCLHPHQSSPSAPSSSSSPSSVRSASASLSTSPSASPTTKVANKASQAGETLKKAFKNLPSTFSSNNKSSATNTSNNNNNTANANSPPLRSTSSSMVASAPAAASPFAASSSAVPLTRTEKKKRFAGGRNAVDKIREKVGGVSSPFSSKEQQPSSTPQESVISAPISSKHTGHIA